MSQFTKYSGFTTNLVHIGERPDPTTGSVIPPIYQTTTFAFETNESLSAYFLLSSYGRSSNAS